MDSAHVIPHQFYRRRLSRNAILSSVCMMCGRCIGFSPTDEMMQLLERCHSCRELAAPQDVPVKLPPERANDSERKARRRQI